MRLAGGLWEPKQRGASEGDTQPAWLRTLGPGDLLSRRRAGSQIEATNGLPMRIRKVRISRGMPSKQPGVALLSTSRSPTPSQRIASEWRPPLVITAQRFLE